MANIGSFKKSSKVFQGAIVTNERPDQGGPNCSLDPSRQRRRPEPSVFVGRAEIGAAWSKRSTEGRDYLSVKLDDPSFAAPIYANLFGDEGAEGYTPIWSRGRKARAD